MDEEMTQQMTATAEKLATAAAALDRVLERLDAQQEALNAKIDRIVAAVEERLEQPEKATNANASEGIQQLQHRVEELEKVNADLKAQAARLVRKTLPPLVSVLLAKSGSEPGEKIDASVLEKALQTLTVDQRIAVKAEMARAGIIE